MLKKLRNFFRKMPQELSQEENLWAAVDQFNSAWEAYRASGGRLRPWIVWSDKELVLQSAEYKAVDRSDVAEIQTVKPSKGLRLRNGNYVGQQ